MPAAVAGLISTAVPPGSATRRRSACMVAGSGPCGDWRGGSSAWSCCAGWPTPRPTWWPRRCPGWAPPAPRRTPRTPGGRRCTTLPRAPRGLALRTAVLGPPEELEDRRFGDLDVQVRRWPLPAVAAPVLGGAQRPRRLGAARAPGRARRVPRCRRPPPATCGCGSTCSTTSSSCRGRRARSGRGRRAGRSTCPAASGPCSCGGCCSRSARPTGARRAGAAGGEASRARCAGGGSPRSTQRRRRGCPVAASACRPPSATDQQRSPSSGKRPRHVQRADSQQEDHARRQPRTRRSPGRVGGRGSGREGRSGQPAMRLAPL